jgi:acetylornithine/succinyldiaminopimelate/putrescine aminotransferase
MDIFMEKISVSKEGLIADKLTKDPRILEAKTLLLSAIEDHKKQLNAIKPPLSNLKQSYMDTLAAFSEIRGSKLFYPYIGSGIGNGVFVELLDGSVKYDFITGIGVHYLGHSQKDIVSAAIEASISDTAMQGNLMQNGDSFELCQLLVKISGLNHCFLTTSGAMANENAFKLAFQKKYPASRILAFERTFAGRTLAMSQVTDKPNYRQGLPTVLTVDYVPFFDPKAPEESTQKAVATLKKHLYRYPKQHALMCFELVQGEGGSYPGNTEFFTSLMRILKEDGIPILMDEVQTFGRTPELFAFKYYGLEEYADIVTIGKLSHVCATLFKKDFKPKPLLLSQTFTSSTSAIRVTKTLIEYLLANDFYGPQGKISKIQDYFASKLQNLARSYPHHIEGPFGLGAMVGMTLLGGDPERVAKFAQDLFDAGIIGFTAGANPTRFRFLPPVGALTIEDINIAMDIFEKTLVRQVNR